MKNPRYTLRIRFKGSLSSSSEEEWDITESCKTYADLLRYKPIIDDSVLKAEYVDNSTKKVKTWK